MRKKLIILPLSIILLIAVAARFADTDRYFEIFKNLDIFATLFKEVNTHYVDEVNPGTLIKKGIDEMLESLDPYTNYIAADDIETYRMMTTGEYSGIGAVVEKKNGVNVVIMPYEGFAAHEAGLKAGDEIHKIGGVSLEGKTSDEISYLLKGQSKSDIVLTIKRYGRDDMFEVTLKREKIAVESVPYAGMVTDDIGYVRLTNFTQNVGRQVGVKTLDLLELGAKGIILDLRGNPGGLLHEAVNVSNVFIEKGKKIVVQKGKVRANDWTYNTLNEPVDTNIPLVVLTDNGSASASEIVSGVVQDYDRGVLVGRKTFGKGLVQVERPLSYDAVVKITTAKYYTPTGRCIQAIDYSNRNPDGSVGKIPDSLKNEFRTANGRLVYDGGGIDPDVEVETFDFAPITFSLLREDHIFYYATEYYYNNQGRGTEDPRKLRLSDAEYDKFVKWLADKNFDYTTNLEKGVDKLIKTAMEEKTYGALKSEFDDLKKASRHNRNKDLITFKDEILMLLEQEIAGRYFLQTGLVESTFDKDPDVLEAVKVLRDKERYANILNRN
ncbi:MAG: S41 family peptidase [Cyclobacteriaceae bacterium]